MVWLGHMGWHMDRIMTLAMAMSIDKVMIMFTVAMMMFMPIDVMIMFTVAMMMFMPIDVMIMFTLAMMMFMSIDIGIVFINFFPFLIVMNTDGCRN